METMFVAPTMRVGATEGSERSKGVLMFAIKTLLSIAGLLVVIPLLTPPAMAGQPQSVSVKMGYFNLNQVKMVHPASVGLDRLENTAKELLRADADKGNALLAQMQKDGKTKDEIESKQKELQLQISAKVEASSGLVMGHRMSANTEIAQAVNAVAKDKGIDLVVDASGIYSGGDKFAASGEDLTEAIIQRLAPGAIKPAEKPAGNKADKVDQHLEGKTK